MQRKKLSGCLNGFDPFSGLIQVKHVYAELKIILRQYVTHLKWSTILIRSFDISSCIFADKEENILTALRKCIFLKHDVTSMGKDFISQHSLEQTSKILDYVQWCKSKAKNNQRLLKPCSLTYGPVGAFLLRWYTLHQR